MSYRNNKFGIFFQRMRLYDSLSGATTSAGGAPIIVVPLASAAPFAPGTDKSDLVVPIGRGDPRAITGKSPFLPYRNRGAGLIKKMTTEHYAIPVMACAA